MFCRCWGYGCVECSRAIKWHPASKVKDEREEHPIYGPRLRRCDVSRTSNGGSAVLRLKKNQ